LILIHCKISESGSEHDTSGSEDDNDFGEVDLKRTEEEEDDDNDFDDFDLERTEEEEELELIEKIYKGRSRPAKTDHNGERIWKSLELKFHGESIWTSNAEYAMRGIAAQNFFAEHWTVRLRHTVEARIKLAHSIDQADVDESALCLTFWRFYRQIDAEKYIEWVDAHISLECRAVLGLPIITGLELLHLPPAPQQSLLLGMGAYLLGIFDEKGKPIGWYPGSGTAMRGQGMFHRWSREYDNVIDNARHGIHPTRVFSEHSYMQPN
jgi:hypothetical protein